MTTKDNLVEALEDLARNTRNVTVGVSAVAIQNGESSGPVIGMQIIASGPGATGLSVSVSTGEGSSVPAEIRKAAQAVRDGRATKSAVLAAIQKAMGFAAEHFITAATNAVMAHYGV